MLELEIFHAAKYKVFSKLAKNAFKELGSYSSLSSFFSKRYKELAEKLVQLLRSQVVLLSRLKLVEQCNIVFDFCLGVLIFLSLYELFY